MKRCFGCMEEYEEELTKCPHCGYEEGEKPENALHMSPGIVLQERYLVGKVIGYGGFGVTYVGWDPVLDTKIAIKEYLPSEFATRGVDQTEVTVFSGDKQEQFKDGMVKFVEEARKLAQFSSEPGIVKIFDSFECNNTAYIIMEYLDGETIAEYLKRGSVVSEEETIEMMKPLMRSLVQVHKAGIIHRDIAPDNIFMTKDHKIKLIDFGAARYATTSHSRSLTVIIKPGYSPEEQYRSRGDQGAHTDVYSLAATMYRMLTGETPPDALERRAYFENSKKDILKPISSFAKGISKNHETAILNALNIRVEDRTPDMETFLQELESTEKVHRRSYRIRKIDLYKWPTWLKIAASAATACLVLFIVLFLTGVIGFDAHLKTDFMLPEGKTRVPSVVNNDFDKAEEKLEAANLIMLVSGREYSDSIPFNYVLYQDIDPGKVVDENSILRLTISSGEMMRIMPDVQGYELQKAKEQLEGLGINVVTESEISNIFAEGCVVSQSIEPKKSIEKGTEVTLIVSSGQGDGFTEQNVTIPDLRGMTLEEVMKSASTNQFFIKVTERKFDKDHEEGEIIEQSPAPGTASNSQAVEVTVSLGYDDIDVPYVLYFEREEAENFLKSQGLEVDFKEDYNNDVKAGLVIEQSPQANTAAKPGTKVTLTISKGPKPFPMPDVRKMMEEEAEKTLDPYGLIVKETLKINNSQKKGMVLEQSVKKGTQMKKGDTVTLTICDHDPVMKVPDLSDMTKAEAQKALNNTGLVAKFTEEYDDTIESGKVISQDPKPGSNLKDGGTVKVSISKGEDPNKKPPASPVGSGYISYRTIDIDNDGEEELMELYRKEYPSGYIRVYDTLTDYYDIEVFGLGTNNISRIYYDANRGGYYHYSYVGSALHGGYYDFTTDATIISFESSYENGSYAGTVYKRGDEEISEEEYNTYESNIREVWDYTSDLMG